MRQLLLSLILQIKKLRSKDDKLLIQGHKNTGWQSRDVQRGPVIPRTVPFTSSACNRVYFKFPM